MGHVYVTVTFRNLKEPERAWEGSCLVATGATECLLPAEAIDALGLTADGEVTVVLADGTPDSFRFGGARIEFLGEVTYGRVLFGDRGVVPLLGVTALESVGVVVDVVTRQLLRRQPALLLKRVGA